MYLPLTIIAIWSGKVTAHTTTMAEKTITRKSRLFQYYKYYKGCQVLGTFIQI